jgi:hypothetical protein
MAERGKDNKNKTDKNKTESERTVEIFWKTNTSG